MANIKTLKVVATTSFIYVLYLIIGHEFIVEKLEEDKNIYEISLVVLFIGLAILCINTYFIVKSQYKIYLNSFKEEDNDLALITTLVYTINLIILYNLKIDYSIWGYYIGFVIYPISFIIMIISIVYVGYTMLKSLGDNSFRLLSVAIILFGMVPLTYSYMSFEKYVRRNINNYDLRSEWYNINFEATLDNIMLYKNGELQEGLHKADVAVWENPDERENLLNIMGPTHYFSVYKIYLNYGREIICEGYLDKTKVCYDQNNEWMVKINKESNYIKITKRNLIFNNLTDKWKYKWIEIVPD